MKKLFPFILGLMMSLFAQAHEAHHVKHNMILLGEEKIFASHIVYKVPHNYQVILELSLPTPIKYEYSKMRLQHPASLFIFLLDHMDISKIQEAQEISGTMIYENEAGERITYLSGVRLTRDQFKIVFFNELPLSLATK